MILKVKFERYIIFVSIYIIVLLICLLSAIMVHQRNVVNDNTVISYRDINRRYIVLFIGLSIALLLIVGLRNSNIGIDTWNYKNTYNFYRNKDFSIIKELKWYDEPGYIFVIILFNKLNLDWQIYSLFMATVFIVPIMLLIFKSKTNSFFVLVLFVLGGYWTFSMSTMRQATAMGLTVIAFMLEDKRKNILSLLFIAIAMTFHVSALIALMYFVARKIPINKKNALFWLFLGALVAFLGIGPLREIFQNLMHFFGRDYTSNKPTGGYMRELFFILTLILGWILGEENDNDYWKYYKAILISAVLLPIVKFEPTLFRTYMYFSLYEIIFVPYMLSKIKQLPIKMMGYFGYFFVYLFLFFTQAINSSMKLVPYEFFWM